MAVAPSHLPEHIRRMLARVEGMPLEALEAGPEWSWHSYGDCLDAMDGRLAIDAGFLRVLELYTQLRDPAISSAQGLQLPVFGPQPQGGA